MWVLRLRNRWLHFAQMVMEAISSASYASLYVSYVTVTVTTGASPKTSPGFFSLTSYLSMVPFAFVTLHLLEFARVLPARLGEVGDGEEPRGAALVTRVTVPVPLPSYSSGFSVFT